MRMIDADSLIEAIGYIIGKKIYASYPNDKMPDFDKGMIDGYARARSIVFQTPTVDHVKRGQWMYNGSEKLEDGGYCSVCLHEQPSFSFWEKKAWRYAETPYCPNCGAYMMEGESNE